ncbi:hypothetical protein PCAR4_110083 [Paraburkholderia caribensis]|nr:hypothetical protein PCAR4_110083 [Paraburkholderia caribensis]
MTASRKTRRDRSALHALPPQRMFGHPREGRCCLLALLRVGRDLMAATRIGLRRLASRFRRNLRHLAFCGSRLRNRFRHLHHTSLTAASLLIVARFGPGVCDLSAGLLDAAADGHRRQFLRTRLARHRLADRNVQHDDLARHDEITLRPVPRLQLTDRHVVTVGDHRHRLLAAHADQHLARVGHVRLHREHGAFGDVGANVFVVVIGARHDDRRAGLQAHARRNLVDGHQRVGIDADLFGNRGRARALGDRVGRPRGQRTRVRLQIALECAGVIERQEDLRLRRAENHRLLERRVQRTKFVRRHVRELGRGIDVDIVRSRHRHEVRVVRNGRQCEPVDLRVHHDVLDGLQLRNVIARFHRHAQALVVRRQASRFVARDRALHVPLAPVIRGERQIPVAEHIVQTRQIVECSAGGREHVAALVLPHVLLEVVRATRARHELPHARRLRDRQRLRVVRGFDERQERQLSRHMARFQFFDDVIQVLLRPFGHALDVVRALRIPVDLHVDEVGLQVGHLKTTADTAPEIAVRARQLVDGTLVDVDRFFGGGSLAKGVGNGLLAGGIGSSRKAVRCWSLTRTCRERQDQQRAKDESHERLGFQKGWNLQPIVRKTALSVNQNNVKNVAKSEAWRLFLRFG